MSEDAEDDYAHARAQAAEIEAEIRGNAMISEVKETLDLLPLFENSELPGFALGVKSLGGFEMRAVRGDGNCFYRSVLFSYLEKLVIGKDVEENQKELERMLEVIKKSKDDLMAVGYQEFAIESFYDMFVELLEQVGAITPEELLAMFQEDGNGDYFTWYMRVLCACEMRRNAEKYFPFIPNGVAADMKSYCEREVEPMGRECEQVQVIALVDYLGIKVSITYLDGHPFDEALSVHRFPHEGGFGPEVTLLYRPGTYFICYHFFLICYIALTSPKIFHNNTYVANIVLIIILLNPTST
jgi:ubiquitin thioesterase protein OTUB1